ncbi:ChbG/HpnK family deacetylase [Patescibacteria group bacterium]|nr:MAG: ChbG/HpnK family deacetylase [Patescibacteria group bacterium]
MDQAIRRKIIISADDFGISKLSNENILALVRTGKVDRVAVMIDGDGSLGPREVHALANSGVKLDIHLNSMKKIVVDRKLREPVAPRLFSFFWRLMNGQVRPTVMERKWRAEIERFQALFGRMPDGVSAHEYVYFFPAYFQVVIKLAKNFSIPYVRFGKQGMVRSSSDVYRILKWLRLKNLKAFQSSGMDSSDYWVSLDWINNVDEFLLKLPEGKTELVVHPERVEELEIVKLYF